MVVHLEVSGKIAKDLVKAIDNINEECVWSFDSEGLHIMMSDVYKYKMLDINIASSDMVSYSCDNPVELGIVIDRIKDVTKTLKTKDLLMINYQEGKGYITLKSNGLSRSVKLIDINMVGKIPSLMEAETSLANGYSATVDSAPLGSFLKAASKAISFDVTTNLGNLCFSSETEEGLVEVEYLENDIVLKPLDYGSETNYAVSEVSSATSTMNGLVRVRGSEGGIIELMWNLAENSYVRAMIAPRV